MTWDRVCERLSAKIPDSYEDCIFDRMYRPVDRFSAGIRECLRKVMPPNLTVDSLLPYGWRTIIQMKDDGQAERPNFYIDLNSNRRIHGLPDLALGKMFYLTETESNYINGNCKTKRDFTTVLSKSPSSQFEDLIFDLDTVGHPDDIIFGGLRVPYLDTITINNVRIRKTGILSVVFDGACPGTFNDYFATLLIKSIIFSSDSVENFSRKYNLDGIRKLPYVNSWFANFSDCMHRH